MLMVYAYLRIADVLRAPIKHIWRTGDNHFANSILLKGWLRADKREV